MLISWAANHFFSRKADDTSSGYHFFNVDKKCCRKHDPDTDIRDLFTKFKYTWMHRKPQDIFFITTELEKIISRIALENKPFLEISCGEHMGLTPFILKRNPKAQCLVTDINDTIIYSWYEFYNKPINDLQRFHINFARLDNCDLPINNDSLDYVTCTFALNYLYKKNKEEFWKALEEVHRVLKKGGCLLAVEHSTRSEFDMKRVYQECQPGGTLHGIYPYTVMEQIQKELHENKPQWEQFTLPSVDNLGFVIEVKVDDEGFKPNSNEDVVHLISSTAKGEYSLDKISRDSYLLIEELKKTAPYLGIKYIKERYLLVLRKL